jgi:hypothetical protein
MHSKQASSLPAMWGVVVAAGLRQTGCAHQPSRYMLLKVCAYCMHALFDRGALSLLHVTTKGHSGNMTCHLLPIYSTASHHVPV